LESTSSYIGALDKIIKPESTSDNTKYIHVLPSRVKTAPEIIGSDSDSLIHFYQASEDDPKETNGNDEVNSEDYLDEECLDEA